MIQTSVFGFENLLLVFDLLPRPLQTDPNQSRHTLGFGHSALPHQSIPLLFFNFLPNSHVDHPNHNRVVCLLSAVACYRESLAWSCGEVWGVLGSSQGCQVARALVMQ